MSNFYDAHCLSTSTAATLTDTDAVSQSHSTDMDDFESDREVESDRRSRSDSLCSSLHSEASSISTTDLSTFESSQKWTFHALGTAQVGDVTANLIIYHDLLSIWWRLMYSRTDRSTKRELLLSDYTATLKNVSSAIQLRDALNDGDTADLYDSYHATRTLSDVKFVFAETHSLANNERFFAFGSFSAQILFVCHKLHLGAFFDGTHTLPHSYYDWRALYLHHMQCYLEGTLRVDELARQQIAVRLANVVDLVPREHNIVLRGKQVAMLVNHGHAQDGCPVFCNAISKE